MSIFDKFRLDGQVAVITGAGKGIGAAIARAFAEAGADVVLAARTESDLQAVAADIEALGRRALVVPTDVMKPEQIENLFQVTMADWGRIDILVNNAGGFPPGPALDTPTEKFDAAFQFNVSTAYRLSTLCAPQLAERGSHIRLRNSPLTFDMNC